MVGNRQDGLCAWHKLHWTEPAVAALCRVSGYAFGAGVASGCGQHRVRLHVFAHLDHARLAKLRCRVNMTTELFSSEHVGHQGEAPTNANVVTLSFQ